MVRRYVTLDGEILAEEEYMLNPTNRCFWCNEHLIFTKDLPCEMSFDRSHELVTICNREHV